MTIKEAIERFKLIDTPDTISPESLGNILLSIFERTEPAVVNIEIEQLDTYLRIWVTLSDGQRINIARVTGADDSRAGLMTPTRIAKIAADIKAAKPVAVEMLRNADRGATIRLTLADGAVLSSGLGIATHEGPGDNDGLAGFMSPYQLKTLRLADKRSRHAETLADDLDRRAAALEGIHTQADIPGYAEIRVDRDGRVTKATLEDGTHVFPAALRAHAVDLPGVAVTTRDTESGTPAAVTVDADNRVLSYIDATGLHHTGRDTRTDRALLRALSAASATAATPEAIKNAALAEPGRFRAPGRPWTAKAMFSIHDDDTIDAAIPESRPSQWMTGGGYATTLFAVVSALGLRACISMEGHRAGLTDDPPALNANGLAAKRLQDEHGWEIACHSMTARYQKNNFEVPSLDSDTARSILAAAVYDGPHGVATTTVYDLATRRQYSVADAARSGWTPSQTRDIKPYVLDHADGSPKYISPVFPVDYQWGEWFRRARGLGIRASTWVTCGNTASHAMIEKINAICPHGFESDGRTFHNLPPLASTATRMMLEGQQLPGYKGERSEDNTYDTEAFEFYCKQIDDAAARGAWIVLGLHAYRPCWKNSLPGALVSQGGSYPDEWVDPVKDPSTPAVPDGWTPCPGTRLRMLWDLLKHCRSLGMLNVTSSEAFAVIGNTVAAGYFDKGLPVGLDCGRGIQGSAGDHPHYIVGADGSQDYYSPAKQHTT